MKIEHQQQMYDALKRIAAYYTPDQVRRRAWKDWGLDDENEAIEYAYENVLEEAKRAVKGLRRPKG